MTQLFLRPSIWLVILLLLTVWLDNVLQNQNQQHNDALQQEVDYIIENLNGIQVNHQSKSNRFFSANKLTHYPMEDKTQLEHVFFTSVEPDKPLLRVISDHAELIKDGDDIFLTDNVSIIRGNNTDKDKVTMLTDFLHLVPDANIAKTDQPITVMRMKSTLNATGMFMNNQTGEILMQSRVKAHDKRSSD
jgi:lipopolysaccharide export system protein LptC